MSTGNKVLMAITGAALIALGVLCILYPVATILSFSWLFGLLVLISGIASLCNWFKFRPFFIQSGSILFSSILEILLGIILLKHNEVFAGFMPVFFAIWLLVEGINLAIRSSDYRKVGFKQWWLLCAFGIIAAILGLVSIVRPWAVGGVTMSTFLGVGIIILGCFYIFALAGINRFSRKVSSNPWIDEQ